MLIKKFEGNLKAEDKLLINSYIMAKSQGGEILQNEEMNFIQHYNNLCCELNRLPIGSAEKIDDYKRLNALYYVGLDCGISKEKIEGVKIGSSLPQISNEELEELALYSSAAKSPEKVDDYELKNKLLEVIEKKQKEYLSAPMDNEEPKSRWDSLFQPMLMWLANLMFC